jgi:hypothetical protein
MRLTVVFIVLALAFAGVFVAAASTAGIWAPWLSGGEENLAVGVLVVLGFFHLAVVVGVLLAAAALNAAFVITQKEETPTLLHKVLGGFAAVSSIIILGGLFMLWTKR